MEREEARVLSKSRTPKRRGTTLWWIVPLLSLFSFLPALFSTGTIALPLLADPIAADGEGVAGALAAAVRQDEIVCPALDEITAPTQITGYVFVG